MPDMYWVHGESPCSVELFTLFIFCAAVGVSPLGWILSANDGCEPRRHREPESPKRERL